jgi:RHS repeat-associated protein
MYALKDHLGNVRSVVSDIKAPIALGYPAQGFNPIVRSQNDYYPFGMQMPGRIYNSSSYRYGFQGQERDDEIKGSGNSVNYKYRMHDPRLGRFLSLDPLAPDYPHNSPYAFSENRVIDGVELEGLEYATFTLLIQDGKTQSIHVSKDYELKRENTKGAGIQYNKVYLKEDGTVDRIERVFVKNRYGIYQGENNPQLPKVGEDANVLYDDYSLDPIDEADANAKQHDMDFDKDELRGMDGVWDPKSSQANDDYNRRAAGIVKKGVTGGEDNVTGKPVTKEAAGAAAKGGFFFTVMEILKNGTNGEKAKP